MLETIYIVMLLVDIALFIIGLTNCLNLTHNNRRLLMIIVLVTTIPLMVSSFSIEAKYCVYTTDFICHTEVYQDLTMVVLTVMFEILTILFLILSFIGKIAEPEKVERRE
jgi:hypothetical protein